MKQNTVQFLEKWAPRLAAIAGFTFLLLIFLASSAPQWTPDWLVQFARAILG